jgi:hypothetical protein
VIGDLSRPNGVAFVGRRVGLGGPAPVVQAIAHHDDHVHVRIANLRR